MSFAVNLRKRRMEKNFSLQKLADAIGASKAHIWDLERGRATNPSLEILQKLSTTLDVPISYLIDENPEDVEQCNESVVMYRDLQSLGDEDRETIKMMMERLKKRSEKTED